MAQALPIEIYHSIIQNVDSVEDLLNLALCCSVFRDEAQRLLFRCPNPVTHAGQMLFHLAICADPPRLGPLVRSYRMEYNPGPEADMEQEAIFIAYAMRAMRNLNQIEHRASTIMPLILYNHCQAPLESFNYYTDPKATPDIPSLVYHVLPAQPSLTHMIISCSARIKIGSKIMKAAADLCPNLMSLSVSSRGIGKMLLQRKKHLQSLQWMVGTSPPTGLTVPQYNNLNYLMIWILARGLNTSFAQHLSSLTLLELCFDPDWDEDLLESETQFIAQIPHLQYLMLLVGSPVICQPLQLEGGQQTGCPKLALHAFRMRNTLKQVNIGTIHGDRIDYLRVLAPLNKEGVVQSRVLFKEEVDAFRIKHSLR